MTLLRNGEDLFDLLERVASVNKYGLFLMALFMMRTVYSGIINICTFFD